MNRKQIQEERARAISDEETIEPYGTKKKFRRHLGRHMEQLALFALPKNDGELDDDSSQEDEKDDSDHEVQQEYLEDEDKSTNMEKEDPDWQPANGSGPIGDRLPPTNFPCDRCPKAFSRQYELTLVSFYNLWQN